MKKMLLFILIMISILNAKNYIYTEIGTAKIIVKNSQKDIVNKIDGMTFRISGEENTYPNISYIKTIYGGDYFQSSDNSHKLYHIFVGEKLNFLANTIPLSIYSKINLGYLDFNGDTNYGAGIGIGIKITLNSFGIGTEVNGEKFGGDNDKLAILNLYLFKRW